MLFYRFIFDDNFENYARAHALVFAYEVNEEVEKYNTKLNHDIKENIKIVNEMDVIISKLIQNGLQKFYKFKRNNEFYNWFKRSMNKIVECMQNGNSPILKML